ncbi:MAG: cyclic nucleotide-binding domain-containing protein [Opitutaceae bacterium]
MSSLLELLKGREVRHFEPGQDILQQGDTTAQLYVLVEGAVDVLKDDVLVGAASQPGVVFGEMAMLLGGAHTATVRATKACSFHVIANPREFLRANPDACLFVSELLARRLDSLNRYLVDVKHQFEGHDHIGMVDKVLEALMHRQPRERKRPSESTLRHGEQAD